MSTMHLQDVEKDKRFMQTFLKVFHKIKRSRAGIREDLEDSPDQTVQAILAVLDRCSGLVESPYHRDASKDMLEFLLWIWSRDTAYKQQGYYILAELTRPGTAAALHEATVKALRAPETWAVNVYAHRDDVPAKGP